LAEATWGTLAPSLCLEANKTLKPLASMAVVLAAWASALSALPAHAFNHTQVGIIVNTWDPLSVRIGEYYAAKREISFQNMIRVGFPTGKTSLTSKEFTAIKAWADKQALPHIQAYTLTWAAPYRVECMSITSAFAFGFSPAFCEEGCKPTQPSPYFNSYATRPFTQLAMRPTMSIAATSFEQAKLLIDRGVAADGSFPAGTAYLLSTSDENRSVRSAAYPLVEKILQRRVSVRRLQQDALLDAKDVLFYFTGKVRVEGLETLQFMPGAMADHLTSMGGMLTDSDQMSALRWLEAGATGSYGTVVEPCNLPEKFPNPAVAAAHYLSGETLIEAYWKSVAMPGQGIFIGEPLAAPFRRPTAAR
jgi:uncharacterized protein (TIGR03790 family)